MADAEVDALGISSWPIALRSISTHVSLGAVYALVRHYTMDLPPMRVPFTPPPAATYDADAGEIPVPDIYRGEGGAP